MMKKIKILHLVGGPLTAGAFKGSLILHKSLLNLGIDSKILNDRPPSDIKYLSKKDAENLIFVNKNFFRIILNRLFVILEKTFNTFFLKAPRSTFTLGFLGFDLTKFKEYDDADLIHIHWLGKGFIKLSSIKKIKKPVVWTMRDMWTFSGGSHYTSDFKEFEKGLISKIIKNYKKGIYSEKIQFIAISNWLKKRATESQILKNSNLKIIHNNIDLENFYPLDKEKARSLLNISTTKKIILYGAQNPQSPRKGWSIFLETLGNLDKSKYLILIFGNFWSKASLDQIGIEYKSFGFVNDKNLLNAIYSSSDMFIFPSIQEAFGKTWAEAMACGLPIVCFNNTSASDYISHRVNGFVVDDINAKDLKKGIEWVSKKIDEKKDFKNLSRNQIEKFDPKIIAQQYIKIYSEICS